MGSITKPTRFVFAAGICVLLLIVIPISWSSPIRNTVFAVLEAPLDFSSRAVFFLEDLYYFHKNAEENRAYRELFSKERLDQIQSHELRLENERLSALLELKPTTLHSVDHVIYSRVIARSPLSWSRTLWIDKGFEDGMRENLPVFAGDALIGKTAEVKPGATKVILVTDPNCKIGVLLAHSRQEGILYGLISGECRMKYISMDAQVKPGDRVDTAGLGVFFPKGIPVGTVVRAWKEPGQLYQVAQVRLLADLGKVEEVAVLES